MKKFTSLFLTVSILICCMFVVPVSAQEDIPEFVDENFTEYVLSIPNETFTPPQDDNIYTITDTYGTIELTKNWSISDKQINDLGNGSTLKYHLYNSSRPATATYTMQGDIPPGSYTLQYLNGYATGTNSQAYPVTVSYNGSTENISLTSARTTTGWLDVKEIDYTSGSIVVSVTVDTETQGYVRTAAIRLKKNYEYNEYVVMNTAVNNTNENFEIFGSFSNGSKKYTYEDGQSYTQINTTTTGDYVKYNFKDIEPGWYDIHFYNPQQYAQDDKSAAVTVHSNGTDSTFTFDQSVLSAGRWTQISPEGMAYHFTGSGDEYITIAKSENGSYLRIGPIKISQKITVDSQAPAVKPVVSAPSYADGKLTVITNGSSLTEDTHVFAIVAAYTDNYNLLTNTKTTLVSVKAGADDTNCEISLPDGDGVSYKLFIFNNMSSITPLIESYDFTK